MGRVLTQHVDSIRKCYVDHQPYQRISGLRITRATLPRLAGSPALRPSCRHAFSAFNSSAASPDARGWLHGRQWSRGTFVAASILHCPMCKCSRPLDSHVHRLPSLPRRLSLPGYREKRDITTTAAARGMLSSEYAPDKSSSPGTQP